MSWVSRQLAMHRFESRHDWQVDVQSSEMRDEISLSFYLNPGDENLASEGLGRRIDDALVESIYAYTRSLRRGSMSFDEYKSRMGKIEEGMKGDLDCQAFAVTLRRRDLRPASATISTWPSGTPCTVENDAPPTNKVAILLLFYWITSGNQPVGGLTGTETGLPNVWQTGGWTIPILSYSRDSSMTPEIAR